MDFVKGRILSIPDWNAWQKGVAIFNLCQLTADNAGSSADLPDDIFKAALQGPLESSKFRCHAHCDRCCSCRTGLAGSQSLSGCRNQRL